MTPGPKPNLYQYLSYRDWLSDWYQAQKTADARFSYRLFSRRAGVRSPSLLKEIIAGKRNLTARTLEGFASACRLTHSEAGFFADLVALDQGATESEKNDAWRRISASKRFRQARPIEGAMVVYLSNWFIPATRELAHRPDFQADATWLSAQLRPKITVVQARLALDTLFSLGMLVQTGDHIAPADVSVSTPHEVAGLAAHNYHRQMLARAQESIESVSPAARHITGVTVAIPLDLVPVLKKELGEAMARMFNLCDEQIDRAEVVYQLHGALFPLSVPPKELS